MALDTVTAEAGSLTGQEKSVSETIPTVSVVVPAYNAESSIVSAVAKAKSATLAEAAKRRLALARCSVPEKGAAAVARASASSGPRSS